MIISWSSVTFIGFILYLSGKLVNKLCDGGIIVPILMMPSRNTWEVKILQLITAKPDLLTVELCPGPVGQGRKVGGARWHGRRQQKKKHLLVSPFLKKGNSFIGSFHKYSLSSCSVPKFSWEFRKDSEFIPTSWSLGQNEGSPWLMSEISSFAITW